MYEATFHIRGDVAYAGATAGRDVSIELWCNDHCDLLHVRGDADGAVRAAVKETVGVERSETEADEAIDEVTSSNDEEIIVTSECLRPYTEQNVEGYLAEHNCLLLPPLRYEDGGKVVRVLALESESLTQFYRDVEASFQVTVRSKREVETVSQDRPMLSMDSLIPDLSERQEQAVVSAWESGYYDIPRESTTAELAGEMEIDRRTFEEHLRLAENKLIGTLVGELYA